MRLHLSDSDSGDLIFSVVLSQLSRNASVFSSALTTFTVHNSSGTFQIPNEILYYHGYIDSENTTSHLHGTLYHNQGFEGVIHLEHKTFYLEAVDRHKRMSRKDLSLMYETDDLTELTEGMFTFKDLPPDMSLHNHSDEFSNEHHWRINDKHLHNKYGVPKPHMAHHTRYVVFSLNCVRSTASVSPILYRDSCVNGCVAISPSVNFPTTRPAESFCF